ncbi:hypothetical protein CCHR01_03204 [Colletotrichum chrysophilum]|uniref:Uncharacterized protein n=1 Tax=Colletotrichum chrysophilum TaxID=1836956 RepID=A0AAD9AT95_9PEZI|nr:hypothetical protein CCHR01_03204 [Colletotrichum chrysophilum]
MIRSTRNPMLRIGWFPFRFNCLCNFLPPSTQPGNTAYITRHDRSRIYANWHQFLISFKASSFYFFPALQPSNTWVFWALFSTHCTDSDSVAVIQRVMTDLQDWSRSAPQVLSALCISPNCLTRSLFSSDFVQLVSRFRSHCQKFIIDVCFMASSSLRRR